MRFGSFLNARVAPAMAVLALASFGCDDDTITTVPADINVEPESLNFQGVQIGTQVSQDILLTNTGGSVLTLAPNKGNPFVDVFSYDIDVDQVGPSGIARLTVTFAPTQEQAYTSVIELETNVPNDDGSYRTVRIDIQGQGVASTLGIDPRRVDFGNVVLNTTKTLSINITNNADFDDQLEFSFDAQVRACDAAAGPQEFCLDLSSNARFRDDVLSLPAGQSTTLSVSFTPTTLGERTGRITIKTCEDASCEQIINLLGTGVDSGLRCTPSMLAFGQVNPGQQKSLAVTCENIANESITILGWNMSTASDAAFEVETPMPQQLSLGDTVTIEATFAPTVLGDAAGTLQIETNNSNPLQATENIPVTGTGGGPNITVLPAELNFGDVALIAPARRPITITNTGFSDLTVTNIEPDIDGTGAEEKEWKKNKK